MNGDALQRGYDTEHPLTLNLRLGAGAIRVDASGDGRVDLEVTPLDEGARELLPAVRVDFRTFGDRQELVVDVPERRGFFGRNPSYEIRVRCPQQTRLEARTRAADVEVRGRLATLAVKTASGDVEVEEVDGLANVQSASGDVELRLLGGPSEVNTASGDVTVERAAGSLKANVVSGDATVHDARGPVELHTVSGDQRLDAVSGPSVSLNSVSGDVEVAVRRGANVWLDVRSVSGDTSSDLLPSDAPPAEDAPVVELRINTVSGDIRIHRATAGVETS